MWPKLWPLQGSSCHDYRQKYLWVALRLVCFGMQAEYPATPVSDEIFYFFFLSLLKKCVSPLPQCALELLQHSTFLYSQELDSFSNICLRALDGSSYEVRCAVAQLLGSLLSLTQKPLPPAMRGKLKLPSLEEALMILSNGFVRGASGFLKAGGPELLKGGAASRETRVGVTQVLLFCRER